jgi:hypothetical protein
MKITQRNCFFKITKHFEKVELIQNLKNKIAQRYFIF